MRKSTSLQAFTIIEMLIVITVIVILASILLPTLNTAQKKAKIAKTQALVDSITSAFKQYRTDFGTYPPDTSGAIPGVGTASRAEILYYFSAAQFVAGSSNSAFISAGPFMEFRTKDLKTTGHTANMDGDADSTDPVYEVVDAWGNTLDYDEPGTKNINSFDIHSKGPDGVDGNTDDITNW